VLDSTVAVLHEGFEAALVLGLTLAALRRRDLERRLVVGAVAGLFVGFAADALRDAVGASEEIADGTVFVAAFATTVAAAVGLLAPRRGVGAALFAFAFVAAFRVGDVAGEVFSATTLTTDGLLASVGALFALVAAAGCTALVRRASVVVDGRRARAAALGVLALFALRLAANVVHEFSEAGLVPASQRTMAVLGPTVRAGGLFLAAMSLVALPLWFGALRQALPSLSDRSPAARLVLATARRDRIGRRLAAALFAATILASSAVSIAQLIPRTVVPPERVEPRGDVVAIALARLDDGALHRLALADGDGLVRFLAIKTADGKVRTALDACEICGSLGYVQEDGQLICLNCDAEINPTTIGVRGGCNPIPLASEIVDGEVLVKCADLRAAAHLFADAPALDRTCAVCGMKIAADAAPERVDGKTIYVCSMARCRELFHRDAAAYAK